jgi:tetratricopeptide (TPR) repeat protein
MPPEQAAGEPDQIDHRSDVYGLGAILYEILTGRPPFSGSDTDDVLRKVREEEPARPRAVSSTVPPALEAVCLKAIQKKPEDRYQSAADLAQDVRRWIADEPVSAWPEPVSVKARRWAGRHRTALSAGAAAVLVALVSLSIATIALSTANAKERDARNTAEMQSLLAEKSRVEAHKQKAEADLQATTARKHSALAVETVLGLITDINESGLEHEPGSQPLRQKLVEKAIDIAKRIIVSADNELSQQLTLGYAFDQLGLISAEIGSQQAAIEAFQKNIQILDYLFTKYKSPSWCPYHVLQNYSYDHMGNVLGDMGRTQAALKALEKARLSWEAIDCDPTGSPDHKVFARYCLAINAMNAGSFELESGGVSKGLPKLRRATELAREVVKADANNKGYAFVLGVALEKNGWGEARAGHPVDAEKLLEESIDRLGKLVENDAKNFEAFKWLAQARLDRGRLLNQAGRLEAAAQDFEAARSAAEKLMKENPHVHQYRVDLTTCLNALAELHNDAGRVDEALSMLDRARSVALDLSADAKELAEPKRLLAKILDLKGSVLRRFGKPEQALTEHETAHAVLQELLKASPQDVSFQSDLARNLNETAAAYLASDQPEKALPIGKRASELLESINKTAPDEPSLVLQRGEVLVNLGQVQLRLGQVREAEASTRMAVDLERDALNHLPKGGQAQRSLSDALRKLSELERKLGKPAEAASAAIERRALSPDDPKELFDVAHDLGLCVGSGGENTTHVGEVIATLRQAVAHGFNDPAALERDPALKSLRSRDDFQDLVRDLRRQAHAAGRGQGQASASVAPTEGATTRHRAD